MTILLIVLRILHVLDGVFWVGAALAMSLFINPSLRATAELGQKVTRHRKGLVVGPFNHFQSLTRSV